ncbi:RluA family pseudouridine synthase [Roseisolibacter sp. H3M3-2]|uniref:RluA family pseudouridine synthase n=1 Tax=Roseisolibacter sp. H3M3-2 TaxID=3031323 RepID=UPI0023DB7573|nr:RluA family pseudouridine synthase [Roseisolibacter sp. H3M3-2]MDF1504405.1 RluA family pseudouridine synthase [Roseisolibacter sp. H3M3-2]
MSEPAAEPTPGRHALVVGDAEAGGRLDLYVAGALRLSRTQAATLVANGDVTVDGRREKASWRVRAGERVDVNVPPPPGRAVLPEDIPLSIVYEDDELVVIDKPAGMVVHPAPGNWTGTLVNALIGRGQALAEGGGEERPGLVHRIDKDTSGLLVVAKTERAHRVLSGDLAARRVVRRYATVCWGHLKEDRITVEKAIGRDPRDRKRMAVVSGGRAARTDFVRLARFDVGDLLRAHLHTGRTHQIRVHLASIGHPVLGDDTYGGGGGRRLVALGAQRHFLHAAWLRLRHPATGAALDFRAPLPADLRRSMAALAGDPALADHPDPLDAFGFYDDPLP